MVKKNLPANAGTTGDGGLIPGLGRYPGKGKEYSSILAWKVPWTEDSGGLQYIGSYEHFQRVGHD